MIALLPTLLAAIETSALPYANSSRLAFDCGLYNVAAEASSLPKTVKRVSVLTAFNKGSGVVLDTHDPSKLLGGTAFETVLLSPFPNNEDGYFFILGTKSTDQRRADLLIRPDRDQKREIIDGEFVGILAVTEHENRTYVGKCGILDGEQAVRLFKEIDLQEAEGR